MWIQYCFIWCPETLKAIIQYDYTSILVQSFIVILFG